MSVDWEPDPSDSLKTFGAFVQALREHHGHTREQFAPLVRFSVHTVASIELGRRMADEVFVERADQVLGGTGALVRAASMCRGSQGSRHGSAGGRSWSGTR